MTAFTPPSAPDLCLPTAAPRFGARTRAVRAGIASDTQHGAVVPPLHLSSTFAF